MTQIHEQPEERTAAAADAGAPPTASELLRTALVNDDDPRFPWWLPLPGLVLALAWAGYRAASMTAGLEGQSAMATLLETLLWPGAGIFVLTSAATWFGWQLEID